MNYELAVDSWSAAERVVVRSPANDTIALFPLQFVQSGGESSWNYILSVIEDLIESPGQSEFEVRDHNNNRIEEDSSPTPGSYVLTWESELMPIP